MYSVVLGGLVGLGEMTHDELPYTFSISSRFDATSMTKAIIMRPINIFQVVCSRPFRTSPTRRTSPPPIRLGLDSRQNKKNSSSTPRAVGVGTRKSPASSICPQALPRRFQSQREKVVLQYLC